MIYIDLIINLKQSMKVVDQIKPEKEYLKSTDEYPAEKIRDVYASIAIKSTDWENGTLFTKILKSIN